MQAEVSLPRAKQAPSINDSFISFVLIVYNNNIGGIAPVCYSPPIVEMRVRKKESGIFITVTLKTATYLSD